MADQDFELRLQRVLRADGERAVRPFDPVQVAVDASAAGPVSRRLEWRPAGWPAIRIVLIASLLILAAVATLWIVTVGAPRRPSLVDVPPSPPGVALTSPAPAAELQGTWIADRPVGLHLGGDDAPRIAMVIDAGGATLYLRDGDDARDRVASDLALAPEGLRLASRAQDVPVTVDGTELRGCDAAETGTYTLVRSANGLTLTLAPIDDPCPSRSAALARTWTRSLGHPSTGGSGVVDAFDPLFVAELPLGSYTIERATDAITIVQPVPEIQLLAFRDPQGFNDPCDPVGGGRRAVGPGADALAAYFRDLDGLTVDDVSELEVDGLRALRVALHADLDTPCANGLFHMYQPAALSPGDQDQLTRPGVTDSLVIVEHQKGTLMFEVLPAPNHLEDQVIGSIRFLDHLPGAP